MELHPEISIIIPHYGKRKSLKYLIKSILRNNYPKKKLEVIIITDDVEHVHDVLKSLGVIPIKIKVLTRRLWYSASNDRNIGGLHAEGDILAFIDDDIILSRDALKKLVETIVKNPEIGCVRPAIHFYRSGQLQTLGIRFYKKFGLMRAVDIRNGSLKGLIEVDAGGGVMVVPRMIFLKTLFDECLPFMHEDLDFGLRIKKLGHRVVTVRDVIVFHFREHRRLVRVSGDAILKSYFSGRNNMIFHYRHGGVISVLIRFYVDLMQSLGKIIRALARKHRDNAIIEAYRVIGLLYGMYILRRCNKHIFNRA